MATNGKESLVTRLSFRTTRGNEVWLKFNIPEIGYYDYECNV